MIKYYYNIINLCSGSARIMTINNITANNYLLPVLQSGANCNNYNYYGNIRHSKSLSESHDQV